MELDYEFIVNFLMKIKENRRSLPLDQAFKKTAEIFGMTPEEVEKKYVELKDLF